MRPDNLANSRKTIPQHSIGACPETGHLPRRDPAAALVRPASVAKRPRGAYLPGARPHHRAELYRRRLALLADRIPDALRRPRRAYPIEFKEEVQNLAGAGDLELREGGTVRSQKVCVGTFYDIS